MERRTTIIFTNSILCLGICVRIYAILGYFDMLDSPEYKRNLFRNHMKSNLPCFPNSSAKCYEEYDCNGMTCRVSNVINPTRICTLEDWKPVKYGYCHPLESLIQSGHPAMIFMIIGTIPYIFIFITCLCSSHYEQIRSMNHRDTFNRTHLTISMNSIYCIVVDIVAYATHYHFITTILLFINLVSLFVCYDVVAWLCLCEPILPTTHPHSTQSAQSATQPHTYSTQSTTQPQPIQPIQSIYIQYTSPVFHTHSHSRASSPAFSTQYNEELDEEPPNTFICITCMDKPREILFVPCNHICCCATCSQSITSCPVCRQTVSAHTNVFIP